MGISARILGLFSLLTGPSRDLPPNGQADGQSASWVARMQRDDNLWLRAGGLEQQGQFSEARHLYLADGSEQAVRGLHVRAALSYLAAAKIAVRLDAPSQARWEFQQAAELFRRHAEGAARWSLREILWAYDQAASLYEAAGVPLAAAEMRSQAAGIGAHLFLPVDGARKPPLVAGKRHAIRRDGHPGR